MNKQDLLDLIISKIYSNASNEISGDILQRVLIEIVEDCFGTGADTIYVTNITYDTATTSIGVALSNGTFKTYKIDIPDPVTIDQTTGQSTTSVMSQKAVTDKINEINTALTQLTQEIIGRYGPYVSLVEAKTQVPKELRELGLTVGIIENNVVKEYWWKTGIDDQDLILKIDKAAYTKISELENDSKYYTEDEVKYEVEKETIRAKRAEQYLTDNKVNNKTFEALMNGIIKQPGVDAYNTGTNSLAAIYGLTSSNNGTNGVPKENGWDVLVRNDETKGGVNNRYNWNGSIWVDMETRLYDDKVRLNGYLLAGDNPIEINIEQRLLSIKIPINSRVSAKHIDYINSSTIVIEQEIDDPVYLYFNNATKSYGILSVAQIKDIETLDYVILAFITRLPNQVPVFNCAWWTFNGLEQKIKVPDVRIDGYLLAGTTAVKITLNSDKLLKIIIPAFSRISAKNVDKVTSEETVIEQTINNPVYLYYNIDTNAFGLLDVKDIVTENIKYVMLGFITRLPNQVPILNCAWWTFNGVEQRHKDSYEIGESTFLLPDSDFTKFPRGGILAFQQLPTATISTDAQYYLRYIYNIPEGSNPNARFLLMVCNQNMTEVARCFMDGTHLEGIQWVDLINPNTKVPFARALIDADKIPEVSIDYGKDFHLRLIPTNSAINENESIVWFGDSVMANRSTIAARTGAILGIPVDRCAVGGSRFSEREQTNTESSKWHKFDMCILVDAIVSGDFTAQEEAAQWLADNVHIDFLYIVDMIANLKTIDFSTKTMVIFSFGTNDFTGLNLLGDADSTDKKTIRGAIKYVIDKLIGAYPNLKVYFTSPTHRYFQSDLQQSSDVVPNSIELYLIQYVDAIKEQANLLHYPMLDMYRESGLNKYNHRRYFADGVHPNEVGNEYFSKLISAFINGKITLK